MSCLGFLSEDIAAVQRDLARRDDWRAGALQQVGDGGRVDQGQLGHLLRARARVSVSAYQKTKDREKNEKMGRAPGSHEMQ